jgi:hypothetical protein
MQRFALGFLLLSSITGLAAAQANDSCASPMGLTGTGTFAFDNTGATTGTQGQSNPFCPGIGRDLWYRWTTPSAGTATFSLCGQTSGMDSNIAVYPVSSCPTQPALVCDDDACGLESFVSWPVLANEIYMLQLGGSGGAAPGSGTFTLDVIGPPAHDNCATPLDLGTQLGSQYDNTQATTGPEGQTNPCGTIEHDLWFLWTAPNTGTATLETCFQSADDTTVAVYAGSGCPTASSTLCDDNGCGFQSTVTWPTVGGARYLLQIGSAQSWPPGPGSFTINFVVGGPTGTAFCSGDGSGVPCPCGNAGLPGNGCANSVQPGGAHLDAVGNAAVSFDTVDLQGSSMPATASALYFQGTSQIAGGAGIAFGDGLRCVTGSIVRLGTRVNSGGSSTYGVSQGDVPVSVRGGVPIGGGTFYYQVWYRNAASFCTAATFNLTNGLEISWAP